MLTIKYEVTTDVIATASGPTGKALAQRNVKSNYCTGSDALAGV
jgi:hypothetical protein